MKRVARVEFVGTDALSSSELDRFITMWNALEVEIRKGENKEACSLDIEILSDEEFG